MTALPQTAARDEVFADDPRSLPEGSVIDGSSARGDIEDAADYVVVGSGAGGATAAWVLAQAGYSVIILEEGRWVRTPEFGKDVFPAMKQMFRDLGTNMAVGRSLFPVLQGRCVGGGTPINSAIAWRAPEHVIESWGREFGLGDEIPYAELDKQWDIVEREHGVRPVSDEALGNQNGMFGEAAAKLGIQATRIRRYDGGCEASASCLTGCRSGKKLGMNLTAVPRTLHKGGRIYTSARVVRIDSDWGRASAVLADLQAPGLPGLRVRARRGVLVAASAVQTPGILRRSGIRLPALGRHFQAHPGSSIAARFERPVSMNRGATQGFNSTHFVKDERFKLESLSLPPELLAVRLPTAGPALMKQLMDYDHMANWAIVIRAQAQGRIRHLMDTDQILYSPTPADMASMRKGMRTLTEMMFAAGAKEVYPSIYGMPVLKSPDDLRHYDDASIDPRAYSMMASHLFGSARMGRDPRGSVVGTDFQVHGVRGLYIVDSSVFPTNIGVNPQHTIMAMSRLAASRMVQ